MIKQIKRFARQNVVFIIALFAMILTMFIVPVDKKYIDYFDFKTLCCLFSVLSVVCALKNVNFFYILAQRIVEKFGNLRNCIIALVYITFIGSMLIANDMALLTFLPLGFFILDTTNKKQYMAFTFIMQNIAANLGGMLTPFGNPQNLYLYTRYNIPTPEFMGIMLLPFIVSIALITVCCIVFVKNEQLILSGTKEQFKIKRTVFYLILFTISILIVFRGIPYIAGTAIVFIALLIFDRKALKMVDYPLLLTFAAFFVFSGNMARIETVRNLFSFLLNKSTLIFSTLSCQVISNVPSAILLSQFTDNYKELLIGVNIGGTGTFIASLASLITLREYMLRDFDGIKKYTKLFCAFNFSFLAVLLLIMYFTV